MERLVFTSHSPSVTSASDHRKTTRQPTLPELRPGQVLRLKPLQFGQEIQKRHTAPSMVSGEGWPATSLNRRQVMTIAFLATVSWVLGQGMRGASAATSYRRTIRFLQVAHRREMEKYYQYVEFGRKAKGENYQAIAYLFTAFATAELIHAQNFEKILSRLDVEISPVSNPRFSVSGTRDNLMKAAKDEINDIDTFYPHMIKELNSEGLHDAITFATFAWESEKQHRDILVKIQRWAPWFFEKVAKTIDEKTDQYFVCQFCGSTMDEIPPDTCPICHLSSELYRKIEYSM